MKRQIYNLVSVAYSLLRFSLIKVFHWNCFHYNIIERFSPNTEICIEKSGKIWLGKRVRVHRHSKISVSSGGEIILGDDVALNRGVSIYCFDKIQIGSHTEIGPDTKFYDHDHDFRVSGGLKKREFKTSPVIVGNNVWIGCNVVILSGTTIGDNCVIGAGSVLKGRYPANSIVIQKRDTKICPYDFIDI